MEDTFTQLPLQLDPSSKAITTTTMGSAGSEELAVGEELAALNSLHRALLTLETPIPPPPVPVNPKRSAQITKLRESGNASFRKGSHAEAVRMYSFGIEMALGRPVWEPVGLVREELAGLFANRAQAHMAMLNWTDGMVDAEASVEMKKVGNAKAWWRRGRCLMEIGRLEEAKEWTAKALEYESSDSDLLALLKDVQASLDKKAKK